VTQPGERCPVCSWPDPGHDWDVHEAKAAGVTWEGPQPEGARAATSMLARSSSRGDADVIWLAIHSTEGIMRAADLRAWAAWPGSSHASADADGVLLTPAEGFVPYERSAWTLRNGNPASENIELCAFAGWTRAQWLARPLLLERCAQWLADRSRARRIPLRKLTVAQVRAGWAGVIDHDDYTDATGDGSHWDVGEQFPWDLVLPRAQQIADPPAPQEDGFMAGLSEKEQQEALGYLRDLHYGLRRPVVNGMTLSSAVRDVQTRVAGLSTEPDQPATFGAQQGEPLVSWSQEDLERLADQLREELTPAQRQDLLEQLQ
jgi:hypothetical protein